MHALMNITMFLVTICAKQQINFYWVVDAKMENAIVTINAIDMARGLIIINLNFAFLNNSLISSSSSSSLFVFSNTNDISSLTSSLPNVHLLSILGSTVLGITMEKTQICDEENSRVCNEESLGFGLNDCSFSMKRKKN
ncbi:unnamed protein product [Trifolium pratense]|uniref:Uncharacterized protein n=1 Tax=Trifolium pratense TaxID=57577 RepID=A0ACB0L9K3_TRIPR|nr:unnamed protein product [Trifolium pratense]